MTEAKKMKIPKYGDYTYEYSMLPNHEIDKDACTFIKNNKIGEYVRVKMSPKGPFVVLENDYGSRRFTLSKLYKMAESECHDVKMAVLLMVE